MENKAAVVLFNNWWVALPRLKQNKDLPAKGTVAAALVVLERLKENYVLSLDAHRAKGGSQIIGLSKASVQKILARRGETRAFLQEGGRTNRGVPAAIAALLKELETLSLETKSTSERNAVLDEIQVQLTTKVLEYFNRERIKATYNSNSTAWQFINELLELSRQEGKEGPVAEYLVGAKLTQRFPEVQVRNHVSSAQDQSSGERGDFQVGDTVFHVTVAPNQLHYAKCQQNLSEGFAVYLLVTNRALEGAKQIAASTAEGRISVQSVESFVSQNIDELSFFDKNKTVSSLRKLLETYNRRVDQVEIDKSILIEIPRTLSDSNE